MLNGETRAYLIKRLWLATHADKCIECLFKWHKIHSAGGTGVILWFISNMEGYFCGPRSFSYFSALGSEKGGEVKPTQKATLFPSGSVLHPSMNGVLKNITLGTRLFFIPHN